MWFLVSAQLSCPSPTVMSRESEEVASWLFPKEFCLQSSHFHVIQSQGLDWAPLYSLSPPPPPLSAAAACQLGIGKKVKFDSLYLAYFIRFKQLNEMGFLDLSMNFIYLLALVSFLSNN